MIVAVFQTPKGWLLWFLLPGVLVGAVQFPGSNFERDCAQSAISRLQGPGRNQIQSSLSSPSTTHSCL